MNGNLKDEMKALEYGNLKTARIAWNVDREIRFTKTYEKYKDEHPYIREAMCVKAQTEEILTPIQDGDYFAGRIDRMFVGIDPERGGLTDAAYFCQAEALKGQLKNPGIAPEVKEHINFLINFWNGETTCPKCREAFPQQVKEGLPSDDYYSGIEMAYPAYGLGGPCLDYDKLLKLGIPGLQEEIEKRMERAQFLKDGDIYFLEALRIAIDTFKAAADAYAFEASRKSEKHPEKAVKERYELMAKSLKNICYAPPKSYHEAIQLFWLYNLIALPRNYGRMDVYLGDFLANDLDNGIITPQEAFDLTRGLWNLIVARGDNFNNRILIGGKGRRNPENADRFALLALEVQLAVKETIPQLSLRWYEGMDKRIWDKAFEAIGSGCTFPIIYNDDVNITGVAKAFDVSEEEAEQYMMYGCGEYVINHRSIGSPDAILNVMKVLDVTLHNGADGYTGKPMGLQTGSFEGFENFEQLKEAFKKQVEHQVSLLAAAQETIYRVTGQYAAFPFLSLLYDDCLEKGKPLLSGGARYTGGTLEAFGNNTCADALYAIKRAVYDDKIFTPAQLLDCLDGNFEGYERERRILLSLPKYGNDDFEADNMSLWVNNLVCETAQRQKESTSLYSFNVVLINNGDSVLFGKTTGASADGRESGEPLSNGNQPGAGLDQNGPTALLNSMSKLDPSKHAGATHNIKISRQMFKSNRGLIEALIKGYFNKGGTQIMITVTDAGELEAALKNPEKYSYLIVRVGGYSERFINLPREIQLEVIKRTLNEI